MIVKQITHGRDLETHSLRRSGRSGVEDFGDRNRLDIYIELRNIWMIGAIVSNYKQSYGSRSQTIETIKIYPSVHHIFPEFVALVVGLPVTLHELLCAFRQVALIALKVLGRLGRSRRFGRLCRNRALGIRRRREKERESNLRVSQAGGGGGGSLFPCSLPKLPYVPMFPHSLGMFSYCNFSNFVPLFPKIG